ncbi:MAG TPA: hypothetical protein VKR05_06825 [Candidatus Cybelea sp.]|nr:hypothetical protein [Candidatus Cybelea sp.]
MLLLKRTRLLALGLSGAAFVVLGLVLAQAHAAAIPTTYRDHMEMTLPNPERPGDRARADAIVAAARKVMAEYPTVAAAEAAGFTKFLPGVPLPIEHYTSRRYALEAWLGDFDPMHPTSLIFKREGDALQIVGVMYTASNAANQNQLDARVPLSFGTWHRHVDFCKAPPGTPSSDRFGPNARFGFRGSIHTKEACNSAGGTFIPRVFGWMVHVWPMEKTQAAIWAVDAHDSMMQMQP